MLCIGAKNYAQNVNIPDANFKAALVGNTAINTNGDSEIQVSEAGAYTGIIDVSNLGISDLTGIADFINITKLNCRNNQLNNLDVSNNTVLEILYCENNQLNSLDVSINTDLQYLICYDNELNFLNISNCINLTVLNCQTNSNLFCIQVSDTTAANAYKIIDYYKIDANMFFSLDCNYTSTAENLASSLSIFPNPASDYLYISYEGEKKLSFTISDIWGKTLAAWEAHSAGAFYQKEVPIADFPVGIYFLSVQAGDKKVVKKFVKE